MYSNTVKSDKIAEKVNNTNRLVKSLALQSESKKDNEELKQKNERTLIVKKYMDSNIRNSQEIREPIYSNYPGTVIRNARTTVGGSILIELDDKETAEKIKNDWNPELYGGNKGAVTVKSNPPAGIIKNVSKQFSDSDTFEEDIIEEIKTTYPDANVDLFKRNDKFTGTLKIEFNSEEDYERASNNKVKIGRQRYIMERYHYRPRVIICKYCQMFNHVARICRNRAKERPKCGKCAEVDHETKDCTKEREHYKCSHCEGNHETGHKECEVMKAKLESIIDRSHNG